MSSGLHRQRCDEARPRIRVGESYSPPRPLAKRTWADDQGVVWRRRGQDLLSPKGARALLGRSGVRVMHVYDGRVHEHPSADLAAIEADLEEYWSGRADPMASFDLGEFRNPSREVMVMMVEHC